MKNKWSNLIIFFMQSIAIAFLYAIAQLTVFMTPIDELLSIFSFLGLLEAMLFLYIIVFITYITLLIGLYFFDKEFNHKNLMRMILIPFNIFLVQLYLEWLWIMIFQGKYIGDDFREFVLFSLSWVIGVKQIPIYLLNLCHSINLFEVTYWILLAIGLKKFLQDSSFMKRLGFVLMTYGLGWLSWVVFQTYMDITTYY